MDAKALASLMEAEGPICKCVFIPAEGDNAGVPSVVELDMTPRKAAAHAQLGGSPTFVGSFTEIDVVVMMLREPPASTPTNPHTLPAPYNQQPVQGPLLLVRMDENAEPQDFTVEEYTKYAESKAASAGTAAAKAPAASEKATAAAAAAAAAAGDEEGEGEGEQNADGEDEEGDENEDFMVALVQRVAHVFRQQTGRDATPEEIAELINKMQQGEDDEAEEEEEEQEEEVNKTDVANSTEAVSAAPPAEPESARPAAPAAPEAAGIDDLLRTGLIRSFQQTTGRAPTDEEVEELMAQLAGDSEFHDQLLQVQNAIATPGAGSNKRSAAEAGIESTGEKSAKKVSP